MSTYFEDGFVKSYLAAAALTLVATTSQAATTFYNDLVSFAIATDNMTGFTIESFEGIGPTQASHSFAWGSLQETGAIPSVAWHESNNMVGGQPVADGDGAMWYDDNNDSLLEIVLNSAVTAFSIYLTTNDGSDITVFSDTAWSGTSTTISTDPTFFGVISDTPFSTVSLSAIGGPNVGFDELKFGTTATVPLPATGLLLLGGLGALGLRRPRRKS